MWYKVASKPEITGTSAKFWPKSQKIPLISEKTQANPKKTQGIWLKTQCTRGKSLLHPLKKRENKKPGLSETVIISIHFEMSISCQVTRLAACDGTNFGTL